MTDTLTAGEGNESVSGEYTDEDLLKFVRDERSRSIGFEHDSELQESRERALRFIKGDMSKEVASLKGRSSVTSSDVADAINTLMPDLMEIFTGGDDVVAFTPQSQDDEARAKQETDYVSHVIFQQNPGFLNLHTMFYDAMSQKIGVLKYWREEYPSDEEILTRQSIAAINLAAESADLIEVTPSEDQGNGTEPLLDAVLRSPARSRICIEPVAPEDFTVSADTIRLADSPYCAHRTHERVQVLRLRGVPADVLDKLPTWSALNNTTDQARDTAGESRTEGSGTADSDLRQVELVEHYIRLQDGDQLVLWRIQTGADETVLIDKERVNRAPFAAITPYLVAHRFYGQSIADLLIEAQKVGTALKRMMLDSGFFALNQRLEISQEGALPTTILDVLQNEPGVPIISKTGTAVRPIQAGQLNFDVFSAIEFFKTESEQRAGAVRNAQGLKPDTLHDTAAGAAMLANASQKRVRMIARVFAETGIKDLFLGVHDLILEDGESHKRNAVRLTNGWAEVDPTSWGNRSDMTVEVGLGASGQEAELARSAQVVAMVEKLIALQGGQANGPYVFPKNVYAASERLLSKAGVKAPEMFISAPDPNAAAAPPPPDPAVVQMQAKLKLQAMEQQGQMALEAAKLQHDMRMEQAKVDGQLRLAQVKAQIEAQLQRERAGMENQTRRDQAAGEMALRGQEIATEAHLKLLESAVGGHPSPALPHIEFGGEPG